MIRPEHLEQVTKEFNDNCMPEPNTGCWLWLGKIHPDGQPVIRCSTSSRRAYQASRISWFFKNNIVLRDNIKLRRECLDPTCVNPDHLVIQSLAKRQRGCFGGVYKVTPGILTESAIKVFHTKYSIDENECWIWHGSKQGNKLMFFCENVRHLAREFSYRLHIGEMKEDDFLFSICGNHCVNPKHLILSKDPSFQLKLRRELNQKEIFKTKIKVDDNGCWIWMGAISPLGYGRATYRDDSGKRHDIMAHRLSYKLFKNNIDDSILVRHLCPNKPNRSCVNPGHLAEGTSQDNADDRKLHGSERTRDSGHPNTKISSAQIKEILDLSSNSESITLKEIAARYNVTSSTIRKILNKYTVQDV